MNRIGYWGRFGAVVALFALGALSACSLKPYRIDIQQGNVVTAEQVAQLKEGMTRDQVRYLLGTPLLVDVFHADRWDYPYRFQKGDTGELTAVNVAVYFGDHGTVVRTEIDPALLAVKDEDAEKQDKTRVYDISVPVVKN